MLTDRLALPSPILPTRIRSISSLSVMAVLIAGFGCAHQRAAEPVSVAAQEAGTPPANAVPSAEGSRRAFLWKVSGPDSSAWLLGSLHMAPETIYPLPSSVEEAWEQADELMVEADIENADPMELQQSMLRAALFTDGRSLPQVLSEETWETTATHLERLGIDPRMMAPFQPWFVALTLSSYAMTSVGALPEHGVDRHFLLRAREANRAVVELEGATYQVDLLSSFSDREQELFLTSTLQSLDRLDSEFDEMLRAWTSGDVDAMERQLLRGVTSEEDRALYARFMTDRNPAMADGIERRMKAGRTPFVVVGAGHLVGSEGVVELLRARGYVVEQQ